MSKLLPITSSFLQERLKFIKVITGDPKTLESIESRKHEWVEAERRVNELLSILDKLDTEFNSVSLEYKNDAKTKLNLYIDEYVSFQREQREGLESFEKSFGESKYKEMLEKYDQDIREKNDCLVEILFVLQ